MANKTAGIGLYKSCENGNYEVVTKMLTSVEGIDINYQNPDQDGNTPLIIAASNGHSSIVTCLLDAGADHLIQNQLGFNALQIASVNGNSSIIKALMKADETHKAKLERNNSLKLPLELVSLSSSTVDPHDPSGLTLTSVTDSSPNPSSGSPPSVTAKKKRAASMRGGSPQRKVSFAENATSSVMIIPSKEDVKMMLHKNEYNHVHSPFLSSALESSFDGFTATVKNMGAPISKLKFKRKMKRNGTIVPYTPPAAPKAASSSASGAAPSSPSSSSPPTSAKQPSTPPSPSTSATAASASSPPAGMMLAPEKPSVAASALSLHTLSTEETGYTSAAPPLSMMSPKSLSFKNAAHVALATVHKPKHVDEVTEEDESISMSVDLSAMGLYVSFDDLENPVLKKVVEKPTSPSAASTRTNTPSNSDKKAGPEAAAPGASAVAAVAKVPGVESTSKSSPLLPARVPLRGLSREDAGSFHVNLEPEMPSPSTVAAAPPAEAVATTTTTATVVPLGIAEIEKPIVKRIEPTESEDLMSPVSPSSLTLMALGSYSYETTPSQSNTPLASEIKTTEKQPVLEIVKVDDVKKTNEGVSASVVAAAASAAAAVEPAGSIVARPAPSSEIIVVSKELPSEQSSTALTNESSPIEANSKVETQKVLGTSEEEDAPVVAPSVSDSFDSSVVDNTTCPASWSTDPELNIVSQSTSSMTLKMNNGVEMQFSTERQGSGSSLHTLLSPIEEDAPEPPEPEIGFEPSLNTFKSTSLSAIEEGAIETPSSSSKVRDSHGRRHAGDFGNPFSSEHLKEVFDLAQAELESEEEKAKKEKDKLKNVVSSNSGSGKKFQFHHVSDVVAEAIRQNIQHPVTFGPNGVVKPEAARKAQALSSSFSASTTLTQTELKDNIAAVTGTRSVSFATDAVGATDIAKSAEAAVAAVSKAPEALLASTTSSSSSSGNGVKVGEGSAAQSTTAHASTPAAAATAAAPSAGASTPTVDSTASSSANSSAPSSVPASPKMVSVPLVGRKQSVVSVGGRKKSLAMLLSPTVKAIGSATKAGESVESLRSKMFQEAKRRAEEYAQEQARKKEEAAMLAALLKAKQEAEQKRLADLKAKQDAIIARRGKAKGYGFQSIKAGLRHREYKDTLHNSPYIKMIVEKDPDDSDTDSDWEAESQKKTPKNGGAPGVPSSARNSAVEAGMTHHATASHRLTGEAGNGALPSIDVNQNVSSVDLNSNKPLSLWGMDSGESPTATTSSAAASRESTARARDAVSSMLQINDPASAQAQAVRKTLAMIQSDRVLENKFKWAKKVAKAGSAALLTEYHDTLKEQYEEEQSRLFHTALPDIKKSKHPKRAQTAGPYRTKPSLTVQSSQIIGSHLLDAPHFADSVNNHNQSVYVHSDTPLKPSEQALLNTKSKKQFTIVNITSAATAAAAATSIDSGGGGDHSKMPVEDSKLDRAMSLELEETIYNKINENNGSLVFTDGAKELSWHEANVKVIEPHADAIVPRSGSPQQLAATRRFYNNHQIGIGKLVNAYRPWSSPAKLVKPTKALVGFDDPQHLLDSEEPDMMSMTVESATLSNTVSQSLPGSRTGPRDLSVRPESAVPSPIKFENSLTMDGGGSLMRSQVTLGSTVKKRMPLMINLVKASISRRIRSGSSDEYSEGGEEEVGGEQ